MKLSQTMDNVAYNKNIMFHPRINSDKCNITLVGQVLDSRNESLINRTVGETGTNHW